MAAMAHRWHRPTRRQSEHFRALEVLGLPKFPWDSDGTRNGTPCLTSAAHNDIEGRCQFGLQPTRRAKNVGTRERKVDYPAFLTMEVLYQLSYPGEMALQSQTYAIRRVPLRSSSPDDLNGSAVGSITQ